jgi:hypothetical protein
MLRKAVLKQAAAIGLWLGPYGLSASYPIVAGGSVDPQPIAEVSRIQCPQDLSTLTERLLRDLPGYMNRVRTRSDIRKSYVVLVSRPDLKPLPLPPFSETTPDSRQVFFTVLQRRYERDRIVYIQEYNWLFLAQTPKDWRFVMLYSTFGSYPATPDQPPLPPHNNSDGSAAVAIRDWLSDCRAGQLVQFAPRLPKPPKSLPTP